MLSAISFGVFCRSAPSTSAIIRSRNVSPGIGRDLHANPVGQHLGAAGHRRAVAARLANDRRRLAGDGALVHRRDAFDDVAVGRDHLAGRHPDDVALAQRRRRHDLVGPVRALALRDRLGLGPPQRVGLRLAAALGHRFGEVGEQHGQPQPDRDLQLEAELAAAGDDVAGSGGAWSARCRSRRRTSPGCAPSCADAACGTSPRSRAARSAGSQMDCACVAIRTPAPRSS